MTKLIAGLGNPGRNYQKTRHNLGFIAVMELARQKGASFKKEEKLEGEISFFKEEGSDDRIALFLPMTYMNLSGRAIKKALNYYNIPITAESFLVVVDDVYLNFGSMRIRAKGSSGGHNGLKSLEEHLHTDDYARLRLGVGPQPPNVFLEDYVLGKFTEEEQNNLPEFVERATFVMSCWLKEGLDKSIEGLGKLKKE